MSSDQPLSSTRSPLWCLSLVLVGMVVGQAAVRGSLECAQQLVQAGAGVKTIDKNGRPALVYAILSGFDRYEGRGRQEHTDRATWLPRVMPIPPL